MLRQHRISNCCAALWLVLSVATAGEAVAQTRSTKAPDADISMLTQARVTASQTTPDAVNCGPDLRTLLPRVEEELVSGGIRIVKSPEHLLTVSILTAHDPARGMCSSAAMLGAYQLVSFFDELKGGLRSGYVVLWQRGKQVSSAPTSHTAAVESAVNRLTQIFLEEWRSSNTVAQSATKKSP